jgi:ATP-binding cassette subfamily B protein
VANAVLYGVMLLLYAPFMLVVSLILAWLTAPDLVWIIGAVTVAVVVVAAIMVPPMERAYAQRQLRLDEVNNTLQENLSGVRVVKAFNREPLEVQRFDQRTDGLRKPAFQAAFRVAVLTPALNTLTQLGIAATLLVGGQNVVAGSGSIGQVTAFTQYLSLVVVPLALAALIVPYLLRGLTSAGRVFEVVDAEPVLASGGEVSVPAGRGATIRVEGVSFGFDAAGGTPGPDVLHDINLEVPAGQSLGILGATGAGKTALVNLIPRFHDPRVGRITLDGVDLRDIPLDELRRTVGIALQEAVLFQGDLRENLKFADPQATDDRMFAAARTADAFDFVSNLPQKWEAPVARRGYNFSGGQRQRISMARSMVPAPRVLILDDSTSALDVATETRVQAAIPADSGGATVIYVAQRISAVIDLDRIIVMAAGRIVASGNHEQLLATSPVYQEIYQSQLGAPPASTRPDQEVAQ